VSRRRQFAEPEPPTDTPSIPVENRATGDVTACPGPCNRAFRAAEQAAIDEAAAAKAEQRLTDRSITNHDTPFHPGKPTWCVDQHAFNHLGQALPKLAHHGCHETILDRLAALPDLATCLAPGQLNTPRNADIDKTSSKGGGAKAISHAPSPSPGWDTADELIRWVVSLEDWLRGVLAEDANAATHRTLSGSVAYLTAHGTALLASSDAERVGHDVLTQHRRLEHLVGQDRLTHRITEPCPLCNRKGLRRNDGDELVKCRSCKAVWAWDQLEFLARTYADGVKASGKGVSA
jgi:hypothetical protein